MNSKLSKLLIFLITVSLIVGVLPSNASESAVGDITDGIIEYELSKSNTDSIQAFIDGSLSEKAGSSSEWYILSLCQSGKYDFSKYAQSLEAYLENNEISSASTRLKMILALTASGSESVYITQNLDTSIGKQGIMSLVFGLHILNNGIESEVYSKDALIGEILSLQLNDGSWAINGKNGDVDTTAMVIQALSAYYERGDVKTAIDNSVTFLSSKQQENGGFVMYGVNNPESASQVLIALSSLGIDFKNDERFIKNGNSIIDAISLFRLEDGSFSHTEGGNSNGNATVQVFSAMVAYRRFTEGKTPFYILHKQENNAETVTDTFPSESSEEAENISDSSSDADPSKSKISYKLWAVAVIISVAVVICVAMLILKKKNGFLLIAIIATIAVIFVIVTDFKTPDGYADNSKDNIIGSVSISIRCDTIVGKANEIHVPENGIILDTTEFEIADGDTVYDILREATAKNKIQMESNGTEITAYVEGINNIYEFDYGELSGWLYFVNGEQKSVGCGEYKLSPNDKIEWVYSCNMGDDLK